MSRRQRSAKVDVFPNLATSAGLSSCRSVSVGEVDQGEVSKWQSSDVVS